MPESIIYLIPIAAVGILFCFFGKRFYFPIIMVSTFLSALTFCIEEFEANSKGIILGILAGISLAFFVRFVYKAGLFLAGFFGGLVLGTLLTVCLASSTGSIRGLIVAFCAIALGICAVRWCDLVIMAATAIQGGGILSTLLCLLISHEKHWQDVVFDNSVIPMLEDLSSYLENEASSQNPIFMMVSFAILALSGFLFQLRQEKRKMKFVETKIVK